MDWSDYAGVERIEGKVGGKPLLKNTRVPADLIVECLDAGETPQEVADDYRLELQDVLNLKAYRDSHQPAAVHP